MIWALMLLAAAPGGPAGDWRTADGKAVVTIAPCAAGSATLCGRIARVLAAGGPSTDVNNPDPALRRRPFRGLTILSGFVPRGAGFEGGRIYDPTSGKTYRSKLQVGGDGRLKVSGCIAFICQSQYWTRVSAPGR